MKLDLLTIGIACTAEGATVVVCSKDFETDVVTVLGSATVKPYKDGLIVLKIKGDVVC